MQHILASASPCGRCVVWDLRKNEPIIKVSDQSATVSRSTLSHVQELHVCHDSFDVLGSQLSQIKPTVSIFVISIMLIEHNMGGKDFLK